MQGGSSMFDESDTALSNCGQENALERNIVSLGITGDMTRVNSGDKDLLIAERNWS